LNQHECSGGGLQHAPWRASDHAPLAVSECTRSPCPSG
jgi:hypothetical protein